MKVLKTIGMIYLGILALAVFALITLFPIALSVYFKNENYFWLFLINLPVIFGFIFANQEHESGRPKRR